MRKKETLACVIFGKICYVACAINRAGKLIFLRACLHDSDHVGFIDKPAQRSVLGPLLFFLYINDLNLAIKYCKVYHFADDANIY